MKRLLGILGVVIGAFAYFYIIVTTAVGTGEGLSFTTFGLWSALAWISSFTMLKQKANPAIPMIYGVGATTTTIVLLIKGRYGWSNLDSVVTVLVVVCIILWLTKGPRLALVLSIVAGVIACIPFTIMTWEFPAKSPIVANSCFLLSNIFAFISAKAWTLEDRLYSGTNVVLCSLLIFPWIIW